MIVLFNPQITPIHFPKLSYGSETKCDESHF